MSEYHASSNSHSAQSEEIDITSNAHQAIQKMLTVFAAPFPDYASSDHFTDICAALELSPAFREYSSARNIDRNTAAEMLVAGLFFAQLGGSVDA